MTPWICNTSPGPPMTRLIWEQTLVNSGSYSWASVTSSKKQFLIYTKLILKKRKENLFTLSTARPLNLRKLVSNLVKFPSTGSSQLLNRLCLNCICKMDVCNSENSFPKKHYKLHLGSQPTKTYVSHDLAKLQAWLHLQAVIGPRLLFHWSIRNKC